MAPDAEDCEEVERLNEEYQEVPVHQGRRILPEEPPLVQAWIENEDVSPGNDSRTNSPGENRRLLGHERPGKANPRRQYEINIGVCSNKKILKCTSLKEKSTPKEKPKFKKLKDKLVEVLRPPYFLISMVILIVLLHLCGPEDLRDHLEWLPGPWWREPWRLFTYGFVHATPTHLALNAIVAVAVGWWLEREQGWARVAVLWFAGVAAGALGVGALQPTVKVVGASAAVFALLMAHIPNVCLRFGYVPLWWFRPLSVVVLAASGSFCVGDEAHHVAWSAHVFGALVGVLLGFLIFKGENTSETYVVVCRTSSFVLTVTCALTATVFYVLQLTPERRVT